MIGHFSNENVTGETYLTMLNKYLIPTLVNLFLNNLIPSLFDPLVWFQQDRTLQHFAQNVWTYHKKEFPNSWIGKTGQIQWPAKSPDLTPLDLFLWGYLKGKLFFIFSNILQEFLDKLLLIKLNNLFS